MSTPPATSNELQQPELRASTSGGRAPSAGTASTCKGVFQSFKRRDLEGAAVRAIHVGRGYQSSVFEVEWRGCRAAVKDFSRTPRAFRRFVAPLLVAREAAALKRLDGLSWVPGFYARLDRLAFAMELVEGTPLDTFALGELAPEVFPRVQAAIDAIHERGVSHCDLKRRSNLLLTPSGDIVLIDFAAALIGRRLGRPLINWLQREAALVDDKSVPRLKKFVAPELLTEEDRRKLDEPTRLEKWARKLLNR